MLCTDLGDPARQLLHLLFKKARKRKYALVVANDLQGWSLYLGWPSTRTAMALDDLLSLGFLQEDEGRYVLLASPCQHQRQTSPLGSGSEQETESPVDGLRINGSAVILRTPFGRQTRRSEAHSVEEIQTEFAQDDEVPQARPKPKPVEEWEVNDLIDHFIAKVRYAARKDRLRLPVNAFHRGMLAGNLNRWLVEDDVDAVEVKAIIDHFVAAYRQFHKPGADPGKVFIANRRKIHAGVDFNQQTSLSRDVNVLTAGRTFKIPGEK